MCHLAIGLQDGQRRFESTVWAYSSKRRRSSGFDIAGVVVPADQQVEEADQIPVRLIVECPACNRPVGGEEPVANEGVSSESLSHVSWDVSLWRRGQGNHVDADAGRSPLTYIA